MSTCRKSCHTSSACCCRCFIFPEGVTPSLPLMYILTGRVIGTEGTPVSGINITYTVNGQTSSTTSGTAGVYNITVPSDAVVTIAAAPGRGVSVTPSQYTLTNVGANISGLDFSLTVIYPGGH